MRTSVDQGVGVQEEVIWGSSSVESMPLISTVPEMHGNHLSSAIAVFRSRYGSLFANDVCRAAEIKTWLSRYITYLTSSVTSSMSDESIMRRNNRGMI